MPRSTQNRQEIAQEARRWKQRLAGEPHPEEYAALFAQVWHRFGECFDMQVLAPGHYVLLPRQLQTEATTA